MKKKYLSRMGGVKLAQSLVKAIDCRIVNMETDTGIIGWGESVPWGINYLPAYPQGISSGMSLLAPMLIGENPLALTQINQIMDDNFTGHPYIKAALDMACWDILG
jgi:L-alanine-DL-glutamate epimerase-like enolase superfamily enzyme